jgi:hypothetical protein
MGVGHDSRIGAARQTNPLLNYEPVDPVLQKWATRNGLHLYTEYKGESVRSADLIGKSGAKVQIWVQPGKTPNTWEVHVWDYHKRRKDWQSGTADIDSKLTDAYRVAESWVG